MAEVQTATVTAARRLSPHVRELAMAAPPFPYAPGQWLSLRLPVGERPPLVRAYSLAAPAEPDGTLTLCFDRVEGGAGSEYLWDRGPGDMLEFSGPLGNFVLPAGDGPLLLVARYTGVVPFLAMLRALARGDAPARPVRLVYGAPSPEERVYHDELAELARRHDWLEYLPVGGDEAAYLAENAPGWIPFTPLVCGVREFTVAARAALMESCGFERRGVKVENYSGPSAG